MAYSDHMIRSIYMGRYIYPGNPISKERMGELVRVYRGSWGTGVKRNVMCIFDDGIRIIRPFRGLKKNVRN